MDHAPGAVVNAEKIFDNARELALIESVKRGELNAYHDFYSRYVGRVYALCYRLTGDRGMAEDATQEVFIQLWQKLANYNGNSRFTTWLHSVTANITISYMRKQKSWIKRVLSIEEGYKEPVAPVEGRSLELEPLITRLPERARLVFVLHAIEGYRHEEVAEMTGMAVGSSKAQFHRAKQLMREWIDNDSK